VAPPILEEIYTMKDALAFGGMVISLLNHADRVKAGCLAQLVNVIAPIMTENGGPAWRQTIFYPFAQASHFGRGTVLRAEIDSPAYDANYYDPRGPQDFWFPLTAPYLKLAAVHDGDAGSLTLFALNRHQTEAMPLEVDLESVGLLSIRAARTLYHSDIEAVNTRDAPDTVRPAALTELRMTDGQLQAALPPASWTMIRLGPAT
jgi:alpha-N-arabinofuranosidase